MTGLIKCIRKRRIFIVIMIHLGKTLKSLLAATFNLITVTLTSECQEVFVLQAANLS